MKNFSICVAYAFMCALEAVSGGLSNISLSRNSLDQVVVTYDLSEPAIVTACFSTNGVALSGSHQWTISGDVHRLVEGGEGRSFVWDPRRECPDLELKSLSVALTEWSPSDMPDYMVVDLLPATDCRLRYYTSVEFLPGGILSNASYRMYSMPFRRMRSKDVEWTMGTTSELGRESGKIETAHQVKLDYDYYIGVFEVTHGQIASLGLPQLGTYAETRYWRFTPQNNSTWNNVRGSNPPNPPATSSTIGKFIARTGVDMDFPTEAQWEFAARGGFGEGTWGDGSKILTTKSKDANLSNLATYQQNGDAMSETGTHKPNAYGLYDMHGNVREYCLDWMQTDITELNGALCVHPDDPSLRANGLVGTNRVMKGGYYSHDPFACRASYRDAINPDAYKKDCGFRFATRGSLGAAVQPVTVVSDETLDVAPLRRSSSAVSAAPVARRTYHSVLSDAFALDTLTPPGLILILR